MQDVAFVFLALGCVLLFMALFSYTPEDGGWARATSRATTNAVGEVGAVLADVLFHFFGYLAFALPGLVLAKLAMMFRSLSRSSWVSWLQRLVGFILTLCALCALASVSIWRGDELPVGAGGAIGVAVFSGISPSFGFPGSVVLLSGFLSLGLMLFLEFSWMSVFERIGAWVLGFRRSSDHDDESVMGHLSSAIALPGPDSDVKPRAVSVNAVDLATIRPDGEYFSALEEEVIEGREEHQEVDADALVEPVEPTLSDFENLPGMAGKENGSELKNPQLQPQPEDVLNADLVDVIPTLDCSDDAAFDDTACDEIPDASGRVLSDDAAFDCTAGDDTACDEVGGDGATLNPDSDAAPLLNDKVLLDDKVLLENEILDDEQPVLVDPEPEPEPEPDPITEQPLDKDIPIQPLEKRPDSELLDANVIRQQAKVHGLPSVDVLDPPRTDQPSGFSAERLQDLSSLLVQKLADFGVKIEVVAVAPGPVITRFEIQPAPGVKASKITNLAKDLARSMAMISVRVVEVIPGKSVMGIEVPNENRAVVSLSEVLASSAFDKSESVLTLALGHDIGGNPMVANLAKMPHLLVAGTTGSGKSVGVNAMILSMLFKATPEQLRLIMVDPKMLELSVYEGIPHLLSPVITDMKEAANGLRWCVEEMERRYQLLASQGVRNLSSYNKKVQAAIDEGHPILDPLWSIETSYDTTPRTLEPLPYIVIVVDEFADMMMMVGKKVEEYIARIAQKARAAGIHMILATQRPSVDVITGLIKANVPTRIAFQVSSRIDSRTILDQGGAEQLLGYGDMLFMPPGLALPERVHGAFVDDDEVHRVVAEWKLRGEPNYIEAITQGEASSEAGGDGVAGGDEQDELFDQAVAFVTQTGKCSASGLQRKMRIGYNRAARLVESMEAAGIVSAPGNNGAREVLAPPPPELG